ncbi:MAG: AraC family transcriptional regulator [Bacillus sp. (in: firmicutes)]
MHKKNYSIYAYRFNESITKETAQIWSVGWEKQTSPLYNWKGKKRKEEQMYVFQYTLSGFGILEIAGRKYKLTAGKAFFIDISDEYCYYLPENSDHWEFLFITLYGNSVQKCWDFIQSHYQNIFHLGMEAGPIQHLLQIYTLASEKNMKDAYQASSNAYEFMMKLYQYMKYSEQEKLPESIFHATLFAQNHYHEKIGPDEMAAASSLSRYHFTRLFKKTTGITPIQYLTNIRILRGAELLYETKYSIEDIAQNIGYANANYFTKVFRRSTGQTPGDFRKSNQLPSNRIFLR